MDNPPKSKPEDEQALVKIYTELTGSNESAARAVLMYLEPENPDADAAAEASEPAPLKPGENQEKSE